MNLYDIEEAMEVRQRQAQLIEEAYHRGYNEGYSKAENDYHAKTEDDRQSSYELGLNMAWKAAKYCVNADEAKQYNYAFDGCIAKEIFENYTASDAIEKIRAYEEKKREDDEEIKVGDEVVTESEDKGVVIGISNNDVFLFISGWKVPQVRHKLCCKKTGRTFPELVEALKKIEEDEK